MVPLCHIFNALHHMGDVFHITGEEILCFDKYYEICIDLSKQSSNGVVRDGMVQYVDKFDVIGLRMDVYVAAVVKVGGRSDIQVFAHLGLVGNNTKLLDQVPEEMVLVGIKMCFVCKVQSFDR